YRGGQSSGSGWGFEQPGLYPQSHLACFCADHPAGLPAATLECDRSANRLLPDQTCFGQPRRLETGWVQDLVGDFGLASAFEGFGSTDPIWTSQCGREQGIREGDGEILSGVVSFA